MHLSSSALFTTQPYRKYPSNAQSTSHANQRFSDYATKVFGFATFGRIYGTITCISGITQLSQSGLDALTHGPLHNNPIPINATLGGLGALVGVILTVFVAVKGKSFAEKKTEMEADDERERLLSNAQSGYGTGH